MPPRKRKVAETADEPLNKKPACSSSTDALDQQYQWQWEHKPGSWFIFDDQTQKALSLAFNKKETEFTIDDEFIVMLTKPSRKTKKTSYQKRVRVGKADKKCDQVMAWSWEDAKRKRHYYSVESVIELENNPDSSSLNVYSEGKPCEVNPRDMMHSNKFRMFREEADAKLELVSAPAITKSAAGSKAATALKSKDSKSPPVPSAEKLEKTVLMKGKAPVDSECPNSGSVHVFCEGKDVWDCMLNQTNLQNNNNKYYLIQLLKADSTNTYSVWMRWGRVGKKGQTANHPFGPDLDDAKNKFCDKFRDKTKNDWTNRSSFKKVAGKYDMLEMDYEMKGDVDEVDSKEISTKAVDVVKSELDSRLQDLIKLICDVKAMEQAVIEMKYDAKKAPLGKLTKAQIRQGYMALKEIEELIKAGDFSFKLTEACNAFYTRIPHDFGMRPPEKIKSLEILQNKMNLLEALGDIEIAVKVLGSGDHSINPVDRHYISLKCNLKPLNRTDDLYEILERYLLDTHASTHNQYSLQLLDIFECRKDEGTPSNVKNKMLLWHGSRLTNWVGILAKGLRIAPREAPVTGYMFGKGVYFSDCSSKSANYCFPTKDKNVGLLLLNEVSLGEPTELLAADYHANELSEGKHSVKGCGKMIPDETTYITRDGVVIPSGKLVNSGINNPGGYTLQYNEYIVYNTNQAKMKYLMKVKFNFKY